MADHLPGTDVNSTVHGSAETSAYLAIVSATVEEYVLIDHLRCGVVRILAVLEEGRLLITSKPGQENCPVMGISVPTAQAQCFP